MKIFNFIKENFLLLLIAGLVIVILIQGSCNSSTPTKNETININLKKYEVVERGTDTVRIVTNNTIYKPGKDIYHEVPTYIKVPVNVDTAAILKQFYTLQVYKDTLHLKDSLGYVTVIDTIYKNYIVGRMWNAKVNKTTITNTVYLKELSNKFYVGGSLAIQPPSNLLIGGSAILKTKTDRLFGLGVGINSQLKPYVQGSMLWKFSFKK